MSVSFGWVKAPASAGGLDHLGSQAPCTQIYSQLLPGITNVTNRARYYSLYPWVVWSLDRRDLARDEEQFVRNLRRAECLLTLIAERHSRVTDRDNAKHGATMTGRDALLPALSALESGEELLLSRYATMDPVDTRYFQNRLGGLGQYYLGQFQELQLLDGITRRGWILRSREKAEPLAYALDTRVEGDLFFKTVVEDRVSLKRLDALQDLCPCRLREPCKERELLVDLFFDRRADDAVGGVARKRSLLLLLHWVSTNGHLAGDFPPVAAYRRSLYALDDVAKSEHWSVPDPLITAARAWRTYERNDLLSIAVQAVFYTALRRVAMEGARCANAREFHRWFLDDAAVRMTGEQLGGDRWAAVRDAFVMGAPRRDAWGSEHHEMELRDTILRRYRDAGDAAETAVVYGAAARLLMLVAARDEHAVDPYADCPPPPNYDIDYPITLRSLRQAARHSWPQLSAREALAWIVTEWGLKTHLRVALRKLHQTGKTTFKILPTDTGLEVLDADVHPAPTMPRLTQALQIAEDLNLVRSNGGEGLTLSADGRRVLEHGLAH
jgi:hypothetical protein